MAKNTKNRLSAIRNRSFLSKDFGEFRSQLLDYAQTYFPDRKNFGCPWGRLLGCFDFLVLDLKARCRSALWVGLMHRTRKRSHYFSIVSSALNLVSLLWISSEQDTPLISLKFCRKPFFCGFCCRVC